jgi:hypothetical protein
MATGILLEDWRGRREARIKAEKNSLAIDMEMWRCIGCFIVERNERLSGPKGWICNATCGAERSRFSDDESEDGTINSLISNHSPAVGRLRNMPGSFARHHVLPL